MEGTTPDGTVLFLVHYIMIMKIINITNSIKNKPLFVFWDIVLDFPSYGCIYVIIVNRFEKYIDKMTFNCCVIIIRIIKTQLHHLYQSDIRNKVD
jgi:hypothetical protein